MSEPTPEPSSQDRDATLISSPLAEVQTHSSLTPQEHTSAGETKAATPNSGVVDVGSQLGPYKLVDKLGEGGMGAVYKARHTKLGKFVAMKILPQHVMSRSDALARFEREMLAVGSLHHPNIVQAHDAGEIGGVHYLSMEYVEGQDLQQLVKAKGPMSVVNACKAIRQAAQGLAAAHKLGLVHRDIKPSNLFVTKQSGQIKILDMGLALLSQEEVPAALTSTGQCFGTPDYMAPEQWSDAHTCDARADLYSLGCTLFFLLVGHPPYHSETHRTAANKMKGHVIDPIPDLLAARSAAVGWKRTSDRSSSLHSSPPSSGERRGEGADFKTGPLTLPLSPEDGGRGDKRTDEVVPPTSDIPDSLNAIYLKLMAKAPEDRFASADQLAEALTPFTRQAASVQGNSSRQAAPAQIDPPQRADSLAGNRPSASALVPKHDAATMGQPPLDQLGATSTWAGSSDAAASRSAGSSQAAAGPLAAAPSRPDRNRLFITGGAAAFVLLLGVIIITITNKDGTKTMIEVPGTDSASRAASAAGQAKSHVSEPTGKSVFDLNREAAEWAHGRGATLFLVPDVGVVLPADELPKTPFIVVHSEFREGANVTNLELDPLKRVRHLRLFAITSPQLPEGLLDVLQAQPWLYQLQIESAGMRTSELARSKSWDTLLSLVISVSSQILDDEWRFLERCPSLQRLRVGGIEQLPNLITRLSDLPNLRNLDLYDATTVDEQAVAALQVKNPHMRVTVGRGAGSRVVGRDPVRDAIQALLGQNAKVFGINYGRGVPEEITSDNLNDATPWLVAEIHLEATTRCTEENQRHLASLESGQFLTLIAGQNVDADEWARAMSRRRLVQNFYTSGAGFTDEGLAHLQHASDIRNLAFIGTRVTRAGLDRFRRVHPTCTINSDLGKFEPDYEAVPEPISPKQSSIQPTGWHGWPADAPKPAIAPFNAEQAKKHQEEWAAYLKVPVEYTNSIGMKFRLIPPGEFMMGSSEIEVEAALANAVGNKDWMEHIRSERPAHRVILTQPFYLGRHEVTQSQFASVTGKNPSQYASTGKQREIVEGMDTAAHPVETVSWDDAFTFCNQLSRSEGLEMAFDPSATPASLRLKAGYRLPTEGEWEFACRAGTETRFWTGDDPAQLTEAAWFQGPRGTHSVGSLKPNPFGLFDVHGNVFEWVFDNWSADYYGDFLLQSAIDPTGPEVSTRRGIRGGPFSITATACRSAGRHATQKEFKDEALGFRAAVSVDAVREAMRRRSNTGWHGWPADAPKPAIAPFDAAQAKKHQEEWAKYLNLPVQWTNSIGMTFQLIPPAEFTMGSSPEQVAATVKVYGDASWKNWAPSEGPQHRVVLTRPFYLGTHEVRQRDYESVMGNNPSGFAKTGKNPMYADLVKGLDTSDHPVETVSWFDAAEFCAKLAMNEGLSPAYATGMRPTFPIEGNGYRLPTEAEWEFTARAGSTTDSWNGDGPARLAEIAWCAENSGGRTHPVGQRLANPFGLFDMQGQVWEWCQDGWTQDGYQRRVAAPVINPLEAPGQYVRKVVRGSFVTDDLVFSYATIRRAFDPNNGGDSYGLRVAIGIDAVAAKLNRPLPKTTAPIAKPNPFVASSDWKAARFLLDQGASIQIKLGSTYVDLSGRDKPLPMEPFRLVLVWCGDASRLTKDQIRELSQCQSLMSLTLAQLSLTDDDVKPLTEIRSLSSLSLHGPKRTTQSLAAFSGASQLELFSSWEPLPAGSMSDALSKLTRLRDARVRYLKAEDLLEWSKQPSFARIRALHLGSPEGLTDDMIAEIQSRNPKVSIDIDNKIRGKWLTTDYINRMRSRGFVFIGKEYETNGASVREIVVDSQNGPPTETPYAIFGLKIQPDATFTLDDLRELNLFPLLVSIDAANVPLNDEALEVLTANVAAGRLYTMNFSGTKISPLSIRWLARLARADSLDVRKTGFNRSMVDQFRRLLPETYVFSDFGDFPPEPAESRAQDQKPSIDSIVARRIQELDGRGALCVETLTWEFGKEDRLPELPYVVDNVYLLDASQVTAADLQNIARLRSLRNLTLLRLTVDDDALKPLEQLASLKTLALSGEKFSAKALAPFASCPDLRDLNLPLVPRSDGVSQALSDLNGLRSLALFDVKAADVEAYSQSPGFSRLRWLDLKSALGVDDSVVSRLQERNPKLQVMIDGQIRGKNVVKEAIDTLRPRGVAFSAGVVTAGGALVRAVKIDADTPPTDELIAIDGLLIAADSDLTVEEWSSFDRLPRFYWIHSEGNPKVSDAHVAAIVDNGHLNGLTLVGAQLTDASVEHLARLRHLQILNLRQTPLSRSAIERLRRLLPTTRIISEFGDETPDVPTAGNDPRIPVDAERAAALKMLRAGGLVTVQPLGASPWLIITVKPGEELPQGPFVIRTVSFRDRPEPGKVGDEVLRDLAGCRHLEGLVLSGTSVGPRGAIYLGGSPALRHLHVSQKLPTSALKGLADLQALSSIELNVNSIDDDYAFLKSAKSLRALALWGTQSPDWKKLGELTQLRVLIFPDATNLNADEVAAFQAARPECRVLFGNAAQRQMMGRNVIDEATSALLARKFEVLGSRKWNTQAVQLAARKPDDPPVVYVQSVVLRTEVTATESDCVQIDLLNGELQQFYADGQALADRLAETISRNPVLMAVSFRNSELTDAGLAKLQSLASLRSLVLDRTRVSSAGVEKFRQAVPGCQVIFESETFDPQWLPTTYFDVNRRLAVRTLERGGTLLLPVATTPSAPASSPIDFAAERAAAEWVLANKGAFSIAVSPDWRWRDYGASDDAKPLPSEPFVITALHMTNSQVKTELDLERLTRCRYLENLTIGGGTIESPAMDLLTRLPRLKSLSLTDQKNLRTSALPKLGRISTLDYLGITSEMVDDRLEFVRHLPTLRSLKIWGPQPPDIDLLAEAPQLRTILLTTPDAVDDAKLVAVQSRNDKLRIVVGWKGKYRTVGRDPAHEAAKQLVELGVECLGGVNYWQAPTKLLTKADFENGGVWSFSVQKIPASVQLSADDREKLKLLDSYHFTAEGQREADELAKSLSGNHGIATITMTDCDLSDAGLEHLQKLVSLRNINVSKSKVTPAGVERFHRAVPLCMITSDFGVTLPKFMSADTTR